MSESLQPVRGLEVIWRGVYEVEHAGHAYAVEVDFFDFAEKLHLYRDGARVETRKSPARFEVDDGATIEAAMGLLGMRHTAGRRRASPSRPAADGRSSRLSFERGIPRPAGLSVPFPGSC